MIRKIAASALLVCLASPALADDYHYRNILIGEQASGMAGAYIAISDDPSGMFYNPAGIVFSMDNYFSLSGNAFVHSTKQFKNVLAGQDYTYTSSGLVPTFFGLTQNWGKIKWGFAVVVPNQDNIDQDDEVTGISAAPAGANTLKRHLFEQDTTYYIGPALAAEVMKDMTVGASLFGIYRTRNRVDNQLILFNNSNYVIEERTHEQKTYGLYPKLGIQYMPAPKYSLGATISKVFTYGSSRRDQFIGVDSSQSTNPTIRVNTSSPRLESPLELGFGAAYFPTKRILVTGDFLYYTADKNNTDFPTEPTWNISVGGEYYLTEMTALRFGGFTNNANTPKVKSGGTNQLEHTDLYGASIAFAFRSPGSSFTIGTTYSRGEGEGQAIADDTTIHKIEESRLSVYLTGSYQL